MKPLVSVALVVCNVDRFLAESIDSILRQTFTEFEFIIVDFGSSDKSVAIVASYAAKDDRIKFREIPHCGLAEARNTACFLAQGRYIAIMDADDISVENRLLWQVDFMEKHSEVGVLGGITEWIDATGKPIRIENLPTEDRQIKSALASSCPFRQPTVLIRREAFAVVGGYRGAFAPAEDYDLWLRIADHYQFANLDQVVLKYRVHPYQVSFRKRKEQALSVLAARVSASSRRRGSPDPFDSIDEITPAALVASGVSEVTQQTALASEFLCWIRNMIDAGEYAVALNVAIEMLDSADWKHVERWQIANLRLLAARLYWKQKRFAKSFLVASHAMVARPITIGRPLKALVGRLRSFTTPPAALE